MSAWRIEVVGSDHAFCTTPGQTVLESAEASGLRLPFGCRYGVCLNCAARLISGQIAMPPGTALSDELHAAQVFLPCVAEARSDCEIEVGRTMGVVQVNPWAGGG